jgi:hypothetical protein
MSNVSFVRAGLSCIPFVGPVVSMVNSFTFLDEAEKDMRDLGNKLNEASSKIASLKRDLEPDSLARRLDDLRREAAELEGASQENEKGFAEKKIEEHNNLANSINQMTDEVYQPLSEKLRIYSFCGIAGDLLTLAISVSLVALDVLASSSLIFLVAIGFSVADLVFKSIDFYQISSLLSDVPKLPAIA